MQLWVTTSRLRTGMGLTRYSAKWTLGSVTVSTR
jgi:hypothetical protein